MVAEGTKIIHALFGKEKAAEMGMFAVPIDLISLGTMNRWEVKFEVCIVEKKDKTMKVFIDVN